MRISQEPLSETEVAQCRQKLRDYGARPLVRGKLPRARFCGVSLLGGRRRRNEPLRRRVRECLGRGTARRPDHPGADEDAVRTERRNEVLDALRALPTRQREVLALRYYLDLSEAEIAETLGISRGAVKSHASRGAAALRHLLEDAS